MARGLTMSKTRLTTEIKKLSYNLLKIIYVTSGTFAAFLNVFLVEKTMSENNRRMEVRDKGSYYYSYLW